MLFLVVVATAFGSYWQEQQAGEVMASLKVLLPTKAWVIRDGQLNEVPAEELVLGDLVQLHAGCKVPADLRIVASAGLKVDQSMITGESEPVSKNSVVGYGDPLESHNLSFSASLCVEGEGAGIVIRTGDSTLIGALAKLSGGHLVEEMSTLQKEIHHFVRIVTILSICMASTIFAVGMANGNPFLVSFMFGFLVIIVANVPQGLPATVRALICLSVK
jgi:sodium/potassium-transporting ATPase subunit alpha